MEAYIAYGPSGSGKSTKAADILSKIRELGMFASNIERDACRKIVNPRFATLGWSDEGFPTFLEEAVTHEWHVAISQAHYYGRILVISDTLCKIQDRRKLKNLLDHLGYSLEWIRMNTPLEECVKRDGERGIWSVGEDVIRRQWENLQKHKEHV